MSSIKEQIRSNLETKDTEELKEIYVNNDHVAYADVTFEVIGEILRERGVHISEQRVAKRDFPKGLQSAFVWLSRKPFANAEEIALVSKWPTLARGTIWCLIINTLFASQLVFTPTKDSLAGLIIVLIIGFVFAMLLGGLIATRPKNLLNRRRWTSLRNANVIALFFAFFFIPIPLMLTAIHHARESGNASVLLVARIEIFLSMSIGPTLVAFLYALLRDKTIVKYVERAYAEWVMYTSPH